MTDKGKASIFFIVLGILVYIVHCSIYGFEILPWDERLPILSMYLFGSGIGIRIGIAAKEKDND